MTLLAKALRWMGIAIPWLAALPGAWYGFEFGARVGGIALGTLTLVLTATMAAILTNALVERLPGLRR